MKSRGLSGQRHQADPPDLRAHHALRGRVCALRRLHGSPDQGEGDLRDSQAKTFLGSLLPKSKILFWVFPFWVFPFLGSFFEQSFKFWTDSISQHKFQQIMVAFLGCFKRWDFCSVVSALNQHHGYQLQRETEDLVRSLTTHPCGCGSKPFWDPILGYVNSPPKF